MAIRRDDFPLPDVDDSLTAPFFAGAAWELLITRCEACAVFVWYPAEHCPSCDGELTWTVVLAWAPCSRGQSCVARFLGAFADRVPFVSALVALNEDPAVRLATYLVDADPDTLRADEPVRVTFRPLSFSTVPDKSVIVPMFEKRLDDLRRCARRRPHRRHRGCVLRESCSPIWVPMSCTRRRWTIRSPPTCGRRNGTHPIRPPGSPPRTS